MRYKQNRLKTIEYRVTVLKWLKKIVGVLSTATDLPSFKSHQFNKGDVPKIS